MNIEDKLEKLRKDYISIHPRDEFSQRGWLDLRERIDVKPKPIFIFPPVLARSLVFATLLIFILGVAAVGLVQASAGALPGEPLYPVKRVSENVTVAISGNRQIKVENRAQEVVGLVEKRDSKHLEEAAKEYEKAILEIKQEVKKSGKNEQEFKEELKKQEEQFQVIIKLNPSSEDQLKELIDAARRGRNGGQEDEKEDRSGSNSGKD